MHTRGFVPWVKHYKEQVSRGQNALPNKLTSLWAERSFLPLGGTIKTQGAHRKARNSVGLQDKVGLLLWGRAPVRKRDVGKQVGVSRRRGPQVVHEWFGGRALGLGPVKHDAEARRDVAARRG
jgi:hypothetical protein